MDAETTFMGFRCGAAVFQFRCQCGTKGEISVLASDRTRLVPCPGGCGAYFIQRQLRGFFAQPTLELAIEPTKRREFASGARRDRGRTRTERKP
jgi:hypothetical protein